MVYPWKKISCTFHKGGSYSCNEPQKREEKNEVQGFGFV